MGQNERPCSPANGRHLANCEPGRNVCGAKGRCHVTPESKLQRAPHRQSSDAARNGVRRGTYPEQVKRPGIRTCRRRQRASRGRGRDVAHPLAKASALQLEERLPRLVDAGRVFQPCLVHALGVSEVGSGQKLLRGRRRLGGLQAGWQDSHCRCKGRPWQGAAEAKATPCRQDTLSQSQHDCGRLVPAAGRGRERVMVNTRRWGWDSI